MFDFIRNIEDRKSGDPLKIYLTFDIDWAHPEVIMDAYSLVAEAGVKSTWFVTGKSSAVDCFEADKNVDLGIHPNFNNLLYPKNISIASKSIFDIINELREIVPKATVSRSHSLVTGSPITNLLAEMGFTHESNFKVPLTSGITPNAVRHRSGMLMCPFSWDDYSDHNDKRPFNNNLPSMCIVNFHPIHVFLNTESLERYERARPFFKNPKELIRHRYNGYGTRNHLIELFELAKNV